jgi:hypothetical protein
MPILNIDIPALARAIPANVRASFLQLPIVAQLDGIATFAHIGQDTEVRDGTLVALKALQKPAYISVFALRATIQSCSTLSQMPVGRFEWLVAALSTTEAGEASKHFVGKWYRKAEDRWMLSVTAQDMAHAAKQLRY